MAGNAAETLMIRYLSQFSRSISEPSSLACDLFSRGVIPRAVYNDAIGFKSAISVQDKSLSICDAVLRSVSVTPSHLVEFVEAARRDSPAVDALFQEISKDPAYVDLDRLVQMKRATKRAHEAKARGEGNAVVSETQVNKGDHCTISPASLPGDQLKPTLHSPPSSKEVRHEVPFRVKRNFDILRTRFGAIFVRAFKIIKEEDLAALKKYLSASFQDVRGEVKDSKSVEELEDFLLEHTSFTDFPMLEGLAYNFSLKEVEKELVSFTEYRNKIYGQILAEDFDIAGVDECVKDSQTKMVFVVRWAKNKATLRQFQEMITQAFENARKFIHLKVVKSSLLTFICAAPTWAVASLIRIGRESISILRELGVVKLTIGQEVILHDEEQELAAFQTNEEVAKPLKVEQDRLVQMKRATEHTHQAKARDEGNAVVSETQVNQGEHCTVSPVTPPEDQLQATLHSPPPFKEVRHEVPFRVKRNFDILRNRFGAIFVRVFKVIKEKDLVALKKFLLASFQDTRDKLKDVESMEQLREFLLHYTSFTNFPMLEGLAYHFSLEEVEKELVSYTMYRNQMYGQILAKDFHFAGIDECVKDSQTKIVFVVQWAKNDATLLQFQEMISQVFENAGKFIHLKAVHASLLTFICAAPTWVVDSLIQAVKKRTDILIKLGVVEITIQKQIVVETDKEVVKPLKEIAVGPECF